MNLKELLFGGGVQSGDSGGAYRDSIQAWLPIKNIIGGVVITKDNRFVKILEVLPVNIYLKSTNDRQNIISSFAAYLKIAPNDLQMIARTLPADTQAYVEQMQRYAEHEDNEACREMIEDNIREIGHGIASNAMRHRFFLVFQYEAGMRAKRNTVQAIVQRLNEEADTARRYCIKRMPMIFLRSIPVIMPAIISIPAAGADEQNGQKSCENTRKTHPHFWPFSGFWSSWNVLRVSRAPKALI